jgi:hypothetical protein
MGFQGLITLETHTLHNKKGSKKVANDWLNLQSYVEWHLNTSLYTYLASTYLLIYLFIYLHTYLFTYTYLHTYLYFT